MRSQALAVVLALLWAAEAAAEPARCRLVAPVKVFIAGAWVDVAAGEKLLLGRRTASFTNVATARGVGRAANALLDARCRPLDEQQAASAGASHQEPSPPSVAPAAQLDVYRPRPCARGLADERCMKIQWQRGRAALDAGDVDGAWAAFARLDALSLELRDRRTEAFGAGLRRARLATLRALPPTPMALESAASDGAPHAALRIAAVGDLHLGRGNARPRAVVPPNDGRGFLDDVAPVLRAADLAFGNLETSLHDQGESDKCEHSGLPEQCHTFRAPTSFAPTLAAAGFDVLSVENNHATDFGTRGMLTTTAALHDAGIAPAGAGHVAELSVGGVQVAVVAFAPYQGALDVRDLELARRAVAWLARTHDVVVVSFHAGAEGPEARHLPKAPEELYGEPRGDVYAFAHAVVDAGADLVLGHGPHVLRAMERYRGRLIAYSLGNFSSYKTFDVRGPGGESVILEAELAADGALVAARLLPLRLGKDGRPALDDTLAAVSSVRALSQEDLGDALFDAIGRWPATTDVAANALSAARP
ncbi:MAG: CapA family protein [Deltaproteobacteria bacterium]|nr:CapA family protein [Deltaproteobacteria bacterium]